MAKRKKHPGGRPPRMDSRSDVRIAIRIHRDELERWERAANGVPLSQYVRSVMNAATHNA